MEIMGRARVYFCTIAVFDDLMEMYRYTGNYGERIVESVSDV